MRTTNREMVATPERDPHGEKVDQRWIDDPLVSMPRVIKPLFEPSQEPYESSIARSFDGLNRFLAGPTCETAAEAQVAATHLVKLLEEQKAEVPIGGREQLRAGCTRIALQTAASITISEKTVGHLKLVLTGSPQADACELSDQIVAGISDLNSRYLSQKRRNMTAPGGICDRLIGELEDLANFVDKKRHLRRGAYSQQNLKKAMEISSQIEAQLRSIVPEIHQAMSILPPDKILPQQFQGHTETVMNRAGSLSLRQTWTFLNQMAGDVRELKFELLFKEGQIASNLHRQSSRLKTPTARDLNP